MLAECLKGLRCNQHIILTGFQEQWYFQYKQNFSSSTTTFIYKTHWIDTKFSLILASSPLRSSEDQGVAELSLDPIKSLLPSSGEVNTDDSANKSLSGTFMQPVRDAPQKKQVIDTQPAKETVATTDATQSLRASESAEDQERVVKLKATPDPIESSEPVNIIIDPTKSTKIDNSEKTGYGLHFMLKDDLASLSEFETPKFDEATADNILETSTDGADSTINASTDMPAQSDLLGHLQEELRIIHTKVDQLESIISKKVIDDL
ncbi:hypothetical protein Tco_0013445 [Tanacetum coccineum]